MTRHPLFGLALATFGALMLTPDALFMRWSGMGGYQMVGWRGLLMGVVMLVLWALTSGHRLRDLGILGSGFGIGLVVCQYFNAVQPGDRPCASGRGSVRRGDSAGLCRSLCTDHHR